MTKLTLKLRNTILLLIMMSVGAGCGTTNNIIPSRQVPSLSLMPKKDDSFLDKVIVPEVKLENVPTIDILDYIIAVKCKHGGVGHISMGFNPWSHNNTKTLKKGLQPPRYSYHAENITFRQFLNGICREANMYWRFEQNNISIAPKDGFAWPQNKLPKE